MRPRRRFHPALLCAALLLAAVPFLSPAALPEAGAGPAKRAPSAVIQRGVKTLERALSIVLADKPSSVAVIVDVTPNVRRARTAIQKALSQPGLVGGTRTIDWRIAALGEPLSKPVTEGRALGGELRRLLAKDTEVVNTFEGLRRTLKGYGRRHAHIVYLADWRFEDDFELERFIKRRRQAQQKFSVIGSEAAWGQPWVEPFYPRVKHTPGQQYTSNVGRSPFENGRATSPWHGGDTAYPHLPWHMDPLGKWTHAFPLHVGDLEDEQRSEGATDVDDDPEDLAEREGEKPEEPAVSWSYPLPSTWGPYGLMRAATQTGGRYVLFSFNPSGRRNVEYLFVRCNHFPPDLRSRKEIQRDAKRGRYQRAMNEAWNLLGSNRKSIFKITSALDKRGQPTAMDYARETCDCCVVWETRTAHDAFIRSTRADLEALEEAHKILTKALRGGGPSRTDHAHMDRYHADARYLHHLVEVLRFQTKEALAAAGSVPSSAWDHPDVFPVLRARDWLIPVENTEARVRAVLAIQPRHPDEGDALLRKTQEIIDRYGGTPPGECIAKNTVCIFEVHMFSRAYGSGRRSRSTGTPSESDSGAPKTPKPPPVKPRGGPGSGAGGPSTGG